MKAFLATNHVMAVNLLPNISMYWDFATILLVTLVFKAFLQGVDTMRSCRIFTL